MHGQERTLRTFRFEQTDRPGVHLMEGHVINGDDIVAVFDTAGRPGAEGGR